MPRFASIALACAAALAAGAPASAAIREFSYDAGSDVTRQVAGNVTFEFQQKLIFTKVMNVRSTDGRASADLKPADEHALGSGGLSRLIGANAQERDLYAVDPDGEGADLIHAFCPGSNHAWFAFGRLVEGKPLRVHVLGDAGAGHAKLCETLDFNYRGEWKLPVSGAVAQSKDLLVPHFPY